MAKIQDVVYKDIPTKAKNMRDQGKNLNKEMRMAYQSVKEMHKSWYGKRYTELVKSFNELVPNINEMLKLVVKDIPYALETVANNYSQADSGSKITSVSNDNPTKIESLALSNDSGMRYVSSEVVESKEKIIKNFENAKNQMEKFDSIFKTIKWESEAATVFKQKFTSLKKDIITSFENIKREFKSLMEQAQQDIEKAEKANTAN